MKYNRPLLLILITTLLSQYCTNKDSTPLNMDQVYAWCIVPFDAVKRNPEQRIAMLQELGIKKYAYDWRDIHLDEMVGEWQLAKQNNIEVSAVWLWLDARMDTINRLSPANERLFQNIDSADLNTDIWLSFNNNYFDSLSPDQALERAVKIVGYIADRAAALDCKVVLYNHGSWFGQPENQINIIKALPDKDIGIVYSFHHAHQQLDRYPQLIDTMMPYLKAVNLNGMKRDGPMILPINAGDKEQAMIKLLFEKGYSGPLGILGHVETRDVKEVLIENLSGLKTILARP
jgi:sugar phosphate isomerase/epimerase